MITTEVLFILIGVLSIGVVGYLMAMRIARQTMKKEVVARSIFKGFREKIWMTVGLGVLFFGLYYFCVLTFARFNNPELRRSLFQTAYQDPTDLIYLGLLVFACSSFSIYLVRLAIIFFYNTWYKK